MNQAKRILYIIAGSFFLGLGAIGIFVPLLPTTPFWLLTCWFYIRSSEKLYNRVMANRYFGSYMKSYLEDKAIPLRAKVLSLSIMWTSILCSILFLVEVIWVKLLLLLICIGVSWHILSFPTRKPSGNE
ncbi:MAG: YbaN family protein [Tannerellaceae bacterium]|nr:YbaN family protein [Tannerellaceae bacterium]